MSRDKRNTILSTGISAIVLGFCFGGVLAGNVFQARWSGTDVMTTLGLGLAAAFMVVAFVKQVSSGGSETQK